MYHDLQLKQTVQPISAFVANPDYVGEIEKYGTYSLHWKKKGNGSLSETLNYGN